MFSGSWCTRFTESSQASWRQRISENLAFQVVFLKQRERCATKHIEIILIKLALLLYFLQALLRAATLLKKSLQLSCFPVTFEKFLRILFFTEHLLVTTSVLTCFPCFCLFLTTIWLSHGQLWAILKGTASITPMLITAFKLVLPEGLQEPRKEDGYLSP